MYIVKNNDGEVTLYYKKPKFKDNHWLSQDGKYFNIDSNLFHLHNNYPVEVKLVKI